MNYSGKRIVIFTGAGMSAESGLKTFRDSDGLWENYKIEDVATPEAWFKNPRLVLKFYDERRKNIIEALPNLAHRSLVKLEEKYHVTIITQNIDNLHERAGSKQVIHLHGEIIKARCTGPEEEIVQISKDTLKIGEQCKLGHQLRPHIVWFGEMVPMMELCCNVTAEADVFIVIGTSLNVYPAASLLYYAPPLSQKFLIDPKSSPGQTVKNLHVIRKTATEGVPELVEQLLGQ